MTCMNDFLGKVTKREAVFILALVVLCLLLFFFRLGARPLWDVDVGDACNYLKGNGSERGLDHNHIQR